MEIFKLTRFKCGRFIGCYRPHFRKHCLLHQWQVHSQDMQEITGDNAFVAVFTEDGFFDFTEKQCFSDFVVVQSDEGKNQQTTGGSLLMAMKVIAIPILLLLVVIFAARDMDITECFTEIHKIFGACIIKSLRYEASSVILLFCL